MAKATPKRGGKRAGAGRPAKALKHAGPVAAAEAKIRDRLPELVDRMFFLAVGGFERHEEKWAPYAPPEGPDAETGPQPLVLVERKVSVAEPDRGAIAYLIDRILGRPTQPVDHKGAGAVPVSIEVAIGKIYGAKK